MTALVGTRYTSFPTIETVAGRFGMQGLIGKSLAQIADMNTDSRAQLGVAFARWQDKVVKKSIDKATSRPVCFNFARVPVRPVFPRRSSGRNVRLSICSQCEGWTMILGNFIDARSERSRRNSVTPDVTPRPFRTASIRVRSLERYSE
jgi:hypothetical protein